MIVFWTHDRGERSPDSKPTTSNFEQLLPVPQIKQHVGRKPNHQNKGWRSHKNKEKTVFTKYTLCTIQL